MFGSVQALGFSSLRATMFYRLFGHHELGLRNRAFYVTREVRSLKNLPYILDAGSGDGSYSFWLAKKYPYANITAVEINEDLVCGCKVISRKMNLPNVIFVHADLQKYVLQEDFDLILLIDVLEHIEDDSMVLMNLFRSLKVGGKFILRVPKKHQLQRKIFARWLPKLKYPHVRDEYTGEEIRDKVVSAGFNLKKVVYTSGFLATLAWEAGKILEKHSRFLFVVAFPILLFLCYFDSLIPNSKGDGFLITAIKM